MANLIQCTQMIMTAGILTLGSSDLSTENRYMNIFDFSEHAERADGASRDQSWRVVNDTVMGGISASTVEMSDEKTVVFSGAVSLDNNGGFCSVRSPIRKVDLRDYDGIAVRVRSDGNQYKFTLRTDRRFDGAVYQASLDTARNEWETVHIPFDEFVPTYHGRRLTNVGDVARDAIQMFGVIIADKHEGPFRLEIDWVRAYREAEETVPGVL